MKLNIGIFVFHLYSYFFLNTPITISIFRLITTHLIQYLKHINKTIIICLILYLKHINQIINRL